MYKFLIALILLCFQASGCLAAGNILVFGDSLSAAYGIPRQRSWPVLLEEKLKSEAYDYIVKNVSISGETTAGGRVRLEAALKRHKPEVVILELGANDGLRGLPIAQMRENLSAMIRACKKAKTQVLLVGMRLPPNYGADYAQSFSDSYPLLARKHKTVFLPFLFEGFAGDSNAFQADGLHPTADTQPRLLANVWPLLKPLLKK